MEPDERFARLIAPIQSRMFETVWRVLRHAQDAEDALQIVLTTIWQQRDLIAWKDIVREFYEVTDKAAEVLAIVPKSEAEAWLERSGERDEEGGSF